MAEVEANRREDTVLQAEANLQEDTVLQAEANPVVLTAARREDMVLQVEANPVVLMAARREDMVLQVEANPGVLTVARREAVVAMEVEANRLVARRMVLQEVQAVVDMEVPKRRHPSQEDTRKANTISVSNIDFCATLRFFAQAIAQRFK